MLTVALVACTKQKLPRAAPAKELYTGDLFKKSRAYAEANTDEWWVLSAKHGVVHPDEVIAPYDVTLAAMSGQQLHRWAHDVRDTLVLTYAGGEPVEFVFLAGRFYREWPTHYLSQNGWASCTDPLAGLGIGDRKAWMKARTP